MKNIIALLFLTGASIAFAAAPAVAIDDNLNAIVDGSGWGKVGDVIVNNKDNAALIVAVNIALTAKLAAIKATADANVTAALDARDAALAAKAAAETAKGVAETAKAAEAARVAAIVAALKGVAIPLPPVVAQAILTEEAKKKAGLQSQKADLEKQLATMP